MSNTEDYQSVLPEIEAMDKENIKSPRIPVSVYLQEAENLYHWSKADESVLTSKGLTSEVIEKLPVRAGALRQAESTWKKKQREQEDAGKEWKEKYPQALDMRAECMNAFRYAFRNNAELLKSLTEINEGASQADLIQDLSNLSVLGKAHLSLLTAINYDSATLDTLAAWSDDLANVQARANSDKLSKNVVLNLRNRAYTLLKQTVDEVRACGKYAFWRDKDRYRGYISEYDRKHNSK